VGPSRPEATMADTAALLERDAELAAIDSALDDVADGHGRLVVVEGDAGVGKTALLGAAHTAAGLRGFARFRARATALEQGFPYGCLRQLLEPAITGASSSRRERLLAGAAAQARALFAASGPTVLEGYQVNPFVMLRAIYWVISNLADERPLVLIIDDLQWADEETSGLLALVARHLDGLRVAVVVASRPREHAGGDPAGLVAEPDSILVRPRPLSARGVAAICARRLRTAVAPAFAAACHEVTRGNPFYLDALLNEADQRGFGTLGPGVEQVRQAGPASVAARVLRRIADAHPAAPEVVRAIAVLGDGALLAEVAELAGTGMESAAAASDHLIGMSVLRASAGLEFAHPIVREAVYGSIGVHARALAHARAARQLSRAGAADERIAAQLMAAEPIGDPGRVEFLHRISRSAMARGAPSAAAAWLQRALREPAPAAARPEVLLDLGSAELRLGRLADAVEHLTAARAMTDDAPLLTRIARQHANTLTMAGRSDEAVEILHEAVSRVAPVDRGLGHLLDAERASHALQARPDVREGIVADLLRRQPPEDDSPGARTLRVVYGYHRARACTSADAAADHLEEVLLEARVAGDQQLDISSPFFDLAVGFLPTDRHEHIGEALDEALRHARVSATAPAVAYLSCSKGWIALRRGALAEAENEARTALDLFSPLGVPLGPPFALALLVRTLVEIGDLQAAEEALAELGPRTPLRPVRSDNLLLEARGLVLLSRGEVDLGLRTLEEFGRCDERWGAANGLASRWRSQAAVALAAAGDSRSALDLAGEDLRRARRWGAAGGIGIALRARAFAEGGTVEGLREAVDTLGRSLARAEHARALVDLGAALRRKNQRIEARRTLHAGADLARRCGALATAARAESELSVAGGRPASSHSLGLGRLTAAERRVVHLAAAGRSNPEIAQALFVTRKTVETHLSRAYAKLDIAGRQHLSEALNPNRRG
jgi:DNA-binding CsgD family transcriptional regulator